MPSDDINRPKFLQLLEKLRFADRYYALCASHPDKAKVELPLERQRAVLESTGRAFKYDKREKFFQHRDPETPKPYTLGANINIRYSRVEAGMVFGTPRGVLSSTCAGDALDQKQLHDPSYSHDPPYPTPRFKDEAELREVVTAVFALYDEIKQAFLAESWT